MCLKRVRIFSFSFSLLLLPNLACLLVTQRGTRLEIGYDPDLYSGERSVFKLGHKSTTNRWILCVCICVCVWVWVDPESWPVLAKKQNKTKKSTELNKYIYLYSIYLPPKYLNSDNKVFLSRFLRWVTEVWTECVVTSFNSNFSYFCKCWSITDRQKVAHI